MSNLVLNGSFETGDYTNWSGDAWINGNGVNTQGVGYNGLNYAHLGNTYTNNTLTQTINTVNGEIYTLSYYLQNGDSGNGQYFAVSLDGGNTIIPGSLVTTDGYGNAFNWTLYTFVFTATGSTDLTFITRNDPDYFDLTAISVVQGIISNTCFPAKTPITTDQGIIAIEKINPSIHTITNKPIVAITKTISEDNYLVCFEKDALENNIPSQKTIISKNHLVFDKKKMMKAKDFVGKFEGVYKINYNGETLYNILMEKHELMLVNNLICETLHPENSIAKLYNSWPTLNKRNPKPK